MANEFEHAIGASLDYGFDYSKWLSAGENIVSSSWVATTGITLSDDQVSGATTSTFVTGGTANNIYYITNTITTDTIPPRTDSRAMVLSCKRR
jgi:hypothetical protein